VFLFVGFGNGLVDAAWCAWLGNLAKANEVSGFLHGSYSLGATLAPLISSLMFAQGDLPWYTFYYIMVSRMIFPTPNHQTLTMARLAERQLSYQQALSLSGNRLARSTKPNILGIQILERGEPGKR
jgi:hypothetical protein